MWDDVDLHWMQHAIQLAKTAQHNAEVPVGAVLTLNNAIIGAGSNCPIGACDPSAHAEIIALRDGAKKINNYRLVNSTLYVTLEPCVMCMGAIIHARVQRLVFGAYDLKAGAVVSVFNLGESQHFNHKVNFSGGLLAAECGSLLTDFFRERRK